MKPVPFMKILPAVVAGILVGDGAGVPIWASVAVCMASVAGALCALRAKGRRGEAVNGGAGAAASICVYLALAGFASAMTAVVRTDSVLPRSQRLVMTMTVIDNPERSGRWLKFTGRVDSFRAYYADEGTDMSWNRAGEKAVVRVDTSFRVSAAERLLVTGYAGELGSGDYESYARLMQRRGYGSTVWVDSSQTLLVLPDRSYTPRTVAARMQHIAAGRIAMLGLGEEEYATAAAMTIGSVGSIPDGLRDDYSVTGASHLFAVSGLNVGMVAMFVNMLLWLLPVFRYGHLIKNCTAIAAIWAYAMITGLSPSIVRAAMMFTGGQMALAASRTGNAANMLLATATVMLLVNPNYLFDISFQLSFVAVAGIFMFYGPLYDLVRSRYKAANLFWSVFMVGLAASLVVAPLVSYYFGRIPVVGILINPVLLLTSNVVVILTLLWCIMPLPFLETAFATAVGGAAWLQNAVIEVCAGKAWASLPVHMSLWQVLAVYAVLLVLFGVWLKRKSDVRREPSLYETL